MDESKKKDEKELLEVLIREIIEKCNSQWCLYTKKKYKGKRRLLGKHKTKQEAENQEKAINISKHSS
jgi:SH3-like domain-containing protein